MIIPSTNNHVSGDQLLSSLQAQDNIIGRFIRAYPGELGVEDQPNWLNEWFQSRLDYFLENDQSKPADGFPNGSDIDVTILTDKRVVTVSTRLLAVKPNYFRGFRKLDSSIDLSSDLVVLDGRNSSGKTSLTEALEWLFTGELVRRKMQGQGDPKELENCITNQLKPDNEDCWVEAELEKEDGTIITLRRILLSDYGATIASVPESTLLLDDEELSKEDENALLEQLFAGIPPLLMQHSLRSFVLSSPTDRRDYFENLLNLDELTSLIQDAVIGDVQATEFVSQTGSVAINEWRTLAGDLSDTTMKRKMSASLNLEKAERDDELEKVILSVAASQFPDLVKEGENLGSVRANITATQQIMRQETLPILAMLSPRRTVDEELQNECNEFGIIEKFKSVVDGFGKVEAAQKAAEKITEAKLTLAKSFNLLIDAELISLTDAEQQCPVCIYEDAKTLTSSRITEVASWIPLQQAIDSAEKTLSTVKSTLVDSLESVRNVRFALIPAPNEKEEWEDEISSVQDDLLDAVKAFRKEHLAISTKLESVDQTINIALDEINTEGVSFEKIEALCEPLTIAEDVIGTLLEIAESYTNAFNVLDKAVGSSTGADPTYSLRERWLKVSGSLLELSNDIDYEIAKSKAQNELELIRDFLIKFRQQYIETRRINFSDAMDKIWTELREDRYSVFSKLHIPKPRGRGFPVKIEVKASVDDSHQVIEVDALKVFSESQVNVLGIAAFITRSSLLGHKTIIFDDPVQSMDEDHFKSFASRLIPFLLKSGFHVILLTHNDQFARDISHVCVDIEGYVTMRIRHSRREGCLVDEGNRRVGERLKCAEDKVDDGQCEEACRYIRLAVERLYLITQIKYGPRDFNPMSWTDQPAEYMWNEGVGSIIPDKIPEAESRLKEILELSLPGAHDKLSSGETDIRRAIVDLRKYLLKLRLGG